MQWSSVGWQAVSQLESSKRHNFEMLMMHVKGGWLVVLLMLMLMLVMIVGIGKTQQTIRNGK